jgi:hypothetical protein
MEMDNKNIPIIHQCTAYSGIFSQDLTDKSESTSRSEIGTFMKYVPFVCYNLRRHNNYMKKKKQRNAEREEG